MGWPGCFNILISQMPKRPCHFQSHDSIKYTQHSNATPRGSPMLIQSPSQNPAAPQGRHSECELSVDIELHLAGGGARLYLADPVI